MTIVRSWVSLFGGTLVAGAGEIAVAGFGACEVFAAGDVAVPGIAGALCAGRFICCGGACGFGPKYFAHRRITPIDNSDAARIRSSGLNLSFCPGKLTNAPHYFVWPRRGWRKSQP